MPLLSISSVVHNFRVLPPCRDSHLLACASLLFHGFILRPPTQRAASARQVLPVLHARAKPPTPCELHLLVLGSFAQPTSCRSFLLLVAAPAPAAPDNPAQSHVLRAFLVHHLTFFRSLFLTDCPSVHRVLPALLRPPRHQLQSRSVTVSQSRHNTHCKTTASFPLSLTSATASTSQNPCPFSPGPFFCWVQATPPQSPDFFGFGPLVSS